MRREIGGAAYIELDGSIAGGIGDMNIAVNECHIDANDLTACIDEWSPGISLVDGSRMLHDLRFGARITPVRVDDTIDIAKGAR